MKTFCLAPITSRDEAIKALTSLLPGQKEPWLLKDASGDVIAYFDLGENDETTSSKTISADVSGRHFNQDAAVVSVLQKLKTRLGGEITGET